MELRRVRFKDGSSAPVLFLRRREDLPEIWEVQVSKEGETTYLHQIAYENSEPTEESLPETPCSQVEKAVLGTLLYLAELEEQEEEE